MTEEWREIPGYEGLYQVSDMLRVKSMAHMVKCGASYGRPGTGSRMSPAKMLKPSQYQTVNLSLGGKVKTCKIVDLARAAFCPRLDSKYDTSNTIPDDIEPEYCKFGHEHSDENTLIYYNNGYFQVVCKPCRNRDEAQRTIQLAREIG